MMSTDAITTRGSREMCQDNVKDWIDAVKIS
jgi:hypothetical protein